MIQILCDSFEEFMGDFQFNEGQETEKNKSYLESNHKELIEQEEANLESIVNESNDSMAMAKQIRDNRCSMTVINPSNDEEMGKFYFYTDVFI